MSAAAERPPHGAAPPRLAVARRALAAARMAYFVAAAAFLVFAVDMATRPIPWLIGFMPDDTFYYLQVARHLAESGRSTFDGINPTNGYHPGWMALLTAAAAVFPGGDALVRAALVLSLGLHLIASVLIVRALRRLLGRLWGWVAGLCWMWTPLPLVLGLQAMETSLLLAAVNGVLLVYVARIAPRGRRRAPPSYLDALALGVALAVAVWARTDMLLLAACSAAAVAAASRRARPLKPGAALAAGALTLVVPVVSLVPWWIFSWSVVGTPAQDSAAMKSLWGQALHAGVSVPGRLAEAHGFVHRTIGLAFEGLLGRLGTLADTIVIATAVLIALALTQAGRRVSRVRWVLAWLGGAMLLTLATYGLVISDVQVWYVGVPGLVVWLAALAASAIVGRRRRVLVAMAWAGGSLVLGFLIWVRPPLLYPWQRDVLRSVATFELYIPADARVGCFNAGIPAYFGKRVVINLDGLVNHAVHPYWRAHRFERYLLDADIAYVADEEGALGRAARFSSGRLPLAPITSATLTGWPTERRVLWLVER